MGVYSNKYLKIIRESIKVVLYITHLYIMFYCYNYSFLIKYFILCFIAITIVFFN
ncbi:hypothetical protein HanHA300_Chr05g0162121 [Helianthus annuus]|nr:hypothetical protein HanHA300_Chr05g0162121 [Helianthus annuus]KAJ0583373.1 hypothetical protein HanHA89_Chr05g0175801 [Helianthus annuus]KAJ0746110.1 hypothetical protein HanOQP8_Chr05g0173751 [Helianthus annuus]KAJ0749113.1 hypothetical protein HanLR1_Chr05g0166011 [Helianthus annuus]